MPGKWWCRSWCSSRALSPHVPCGLPENGASAKSHGTLLDVAQERIRGLDEQVALLQAQLALEQERNVGLEGAHRKERVERDRMRRVAFILGLVAAGLFGLLVVSVLMWWFVLG